MNVPVNFRLENEQRAKLESIARRLGSLNVSQAIRTLIENEFNAQCAPTIEKAGSQLKLAGRILNHGQLLLIRHGDIRHGLWIPTTLEAEEGVFSVSLKLAHSRGQSIEIRIPAEGLVARAIEKDSTT